MSGSDNRSSEGVLTIRHPRTDFPQQGWIRKPTVDGTAGDFYEHSTDFGWYAPTQSGTERPRPYYGSLTRPRIFYQTEPQQGWIRKATVDGTAGDFYEHTTDFGWFKETQQENEEPRPRYAYPRRNSLFYDTQPASVWFAAIGFDPAQQNWFIPSERLRKSTPRPATWQSDAWIGTAALVRSWSIESQLVAARRVDIRWRTIQPFWPPTAPAFDPSTFNWLIDSQRIPNRAYRLHEQSDVSWIFQNLTAAFDPSTFNWGIDSKRIWPKPKNYVQWRTVPTGIGTPTEFDPRTFNWFINSQRIDARQYRITDGIDTGWLYTSIPAFDPATQPWKIDSFRPSTDRQYRRDTDSQQWGWWSPASWQISSERHLPHIQRRDSGLSDVSWIFPNLPAFDAAQFPWSIPSERPKPKPKHAVQWRARPTGFSVPVSAFDPATVNWFIESARIAARRYRIIDNINTDWIFPVIPAFDPATQPWTQYSERLRSVRRYRYDLDAHRLGSVQFTSWSIPSERPAAKRRAVETQPNLSWLVPSVIFDPQLWPGTRIDSERKWLRERIARHLNPDHAWIFQNLGAFDPSTQPWSISSQRTGPKPRSYVQWRTVPVGVGTPTPQFDPSTGIWTIRGERTSKRIYWTSQLPDIGWLYQNLPAFDPSTQPWIQLSERLRAINRYRHDLDAHRLGLVRFDSWAISSDRPSRQRRSIATQPDFSWLTPSVIFDPTLWPGTSIDSQRKWTRSLLQRHLNPDNAWIFQNIGAFDPATGIWTIESKRIWPGPRNYVQWRTVPSGLGTPTAAAFDPSTYPWIQYSERLRAVSRYRYDVDGHKIGITSFQGWPIQSDRPSRIRRAIFEQPVLSWLVPSVIFDPTLYPATAIPSYRHWVKKRGLWQPDLDNAWIFQSTAAFDPSTFPWPIPSFVDRAKRNNYVQWRTVQTAYGIEIQAFDPKLFPATGISSYRHWVKKRGLWQPDLDNAWMFENLPAEFDPRNMAWGIPDRRLDKLNRRSQQWQYDPDFGWIYVNPLPPVIPPPTINYQGDGKKRRRKKKKFFNLFSEIEHTIRTTIAGPVSVEDLPRASVASQPVPYEESELDRLFAEAAEYEDLSVRVEALRRDLSAYKALREQQMIEDDDDDMWILM